MASAASSARIRASTSAISASLRAASSRVARSSSSSSKTSASSSGSAWTWPRISVSSALEASSSRSAIWAGLSRRIRASGPRRPALPACPISGSNLDQSRNSCSLRSWSSRRPNRRAQPAGPAAGVHPGQHPSRPVGVHCWRSSRSAARTRCAARHVDEPVAQHVAAQQHLAVPALEAAQVQLGAGQLELLAVEAPVCSTGTNTSRPPTLATSPLTTGSGLPAQPARSRRPPGPATRPGCR